MLDILHGSSDCSASMARLIQVLSLCMRRRMSGGQEHQTQHSKCRCSMEHATAVLRVMPCVGPLH